MKFAFYSKKNQLDEMQEQTLRKIGENGYLVMWTGLLAAIVVQMVTGADMKQIAGEWVVFMVGCLYTLVECIRNGLWDRHLSDKTPANVLYSVIAAVSVTLLSGFAYGYWVGAAVAGVLTGILCFVLLQLCAHAARTRRRQLDDSDDNEE